MSTPARPNVLWIFCEDLSPWFDPFGVDRVPAPHLQRLAGEGLACRRCFSPAPVCSPARSGIITGCHPTRLGVHQHVSSRPGMPAIALPEPVRPLPVLFREAGYFTYNMGKDDYNFAYARPDLYHGPYLTNQFYGEHDARNAGWHIRQRDWRAWRYRDPGQPFFGQVTLWAGKNETRVAPPTDPAQVRVMPCYPDTPEFRTEIARHHDQIRTTDHEVGEILSALRADGLLDRTWVFFFSDHGYGLIRHKQFCYDGGTHVPLLIRPPDGSAFPWTGTVREGLCRSLDVGATSLAAAGLPVPPWMDSRDLLAPDYACPAVVSARDRCDGTIDWIRSVRTDRYRYLRNFLTDRPLLQPQYRSQTPCFLQLRRMFREGRLSPEAAAYAGDFRPAEELYDHASDPDEVHNLAEDPRSAEVLREHREILRRWSAETGDRGGQPESPAQYAWLLRQWGPEQCWSPEYAQATP